MRVVPVLCDSSRLRVKVSYSAAIEDVESVSVVLEEGLDFGGHGVLSLSFWKMPANWLVVLPNVRAKRATTAWRAGQKAQNGPQAQRLMASVACRWRSA
jgi:hypothetical protein